MLESSCHIGSGCLADTTNAVYSTISLVGLESLFLRAVAVQMSYFKKDVIILDAGFSRIGRRTGTPGLKLARGLCGLPYNAAV